MKFSLLVTLLTLSCLAPLSAQATWTSYLAGDLARDAGESVAAVEAALLGRQEASREALAGYRELYVSARQESLSPAEFSSLLDQLVQSRSIPTRLEEELQGDINDKRDVIRQILTESPPAVGTSSYGEAEAWLRFIARSTGASSEAAERLVDDIGRLGQAAGDDQLRDVIDGLGLPLPSAFLNGSPGDQFLQTMGSWWLVFLAERDDRARASSLSRLAALVRMLDPALETRATSIAIGYRLSAARRATITAAVGEALPYVNAAGIVSVPVVDAVLAELLSVLNPASREDLRSVAIMDATIRFVLETLEHLLRSLPDRNTAELASRAGLLPASLERLRGRLYRVRLDLIAEERDSAAAAERAGGAAFTGSEGYDDELRLMENYRLDGESFVTGLRPWVTGESSRTGDSYRWAMLSVLSNRYAQRLILSSADYEAEQKVVGDFVRDLYGRFEETTARQIAELERETQTESVDSYDRVYRVTSAAGGRDVSPDDVYQAFVNEAQGDELIGTIMGGSDLQPAVVAAWAHTHGFHLSPGGSGQEQDPGLPHSTSWFALANEAENDLQSVGFAVRGTDALGRELRSIIDPVRKAAALPSIAIYDVRLSRAMELLSADRLYESPPGQTVAILYSLYPDAGSVTELIAALTRSALALRETISDIELADRRAIRRGTMP